MAFVDSRPVAYDESKVWDEETGLWYDGDTEIGSERNVQAGSVYKQQIVVISGQAKIYFGDL